MRLKMMAALLLGVALTSIGCKLPTDYVESMDADIRWLQDDVVRLRREVRDLRDEHASRPPCRCQPYHRPTGDLPFGKIGSAESIEE